MQTIEWDWPLADPNGGADGSAMSKLFRGGSLSDTALLAREAVQNSSDATRSAAPGSAPSQLRMIFRFEALRGAEKTEAVEALGLRGMAQRRAAYTKNPLRPGNILDNLDNSREPLKLLYVEDYGTHGLYGDPNDYLNSHLFKAMYQIGASNKDSEAGGSYGFGKSALERASRTHSVIAHSTFEKHEDDAARTRLIGFTWWPNVQVDRDMYNGRASFSDHHATGPGGWSIATPFVDAAADRIADQLGFRLRNPDRPEELGTSFLIIDPAIEPDELVTELEKWWWPALEEHRMDLQVILPSGEIRVPKPANNAFVAQFLPAFRIATKLDAPVDPNRERLASKSWRNRSGLGGQDLGNLGLVVADAPAEETYDGSDNTALVALMRTPRMVIQYAQFPKRRVPLRGVFVASDKINGTLRMTEPASHDQWTHNSSADVPDEAINTAKTVMDKIRRSLADMAKDITPPPPKTNRALGHFSRLMNGFMGNKRGPTAPPRAGGERIELQFPDGRPEPVVVDDYDLQVKSRFTVRVSDSAARSACQARVSCQVFIHEDEALSKSTVPVLLRPHGSNHGFTQEEDGSWTGPISKAEKTTFVVESERYPNIWTTSLQPTVARISDWSDQ